MIKERDAREKNEKTNMCNNSIIFPPTTRDDDDYEEEEEETEGRWRYKGGREGGRDGEREGGKGGSKPSLEKKGERRRKKRGTQPWLTNSIKSFIIRVEAGRREARRQVDCGGTQVMTTRREKLSIHRKVTR